MAIRCLTKQDQKYVLYFYKINLYTITQLAEMFHVSRRTIKRVIDNDFMDSVLND